MIDPRNYGGGDDDTGFGQSPIPTMPSAENYGGPSIADQMSSQYPLRHGPAPYVGISSYGDQQALFTQNRASYGAYPAAMMSGAGALSGGIQLGASNMFSDMGRMIRPMGYTPPAQVMTGYAGRYVQETGFLSDIGIVAGLKGAPFGVRPSEYNYNASSDLGQRLGLGAVGLGMSAGVIGASSLAGSAASSFFTKGLAEGFKRTAIGGGGFVLGSLGAFAVAGAAAEEVTKGIAARTDVQNFLEASSDRFITTSSRGLSDPRRGGFDPQSRRAVAEFVRKTELNDPQLSADNLSTVLKGSSQLGLFAGTTGVEDFQKKFKSIVDNVKVVSRTLRQTLEEGLKTIKDLKGIGVEGLGVSNLALRSEITGRMSGRTAAEMMNLGLQGAEMFRGTGVDMRIGFESTQMNLASIRAARDAKMLSSEAIAQAGGEEALSQRLTASSLSHTQTAVGRGFGALYYNRSAGGSGFDKNAFISSAMGGGMDARTAAIQAAKNIGTPQDMLRYEANQEQINSEIGKMFGGQGLQVRQMTEIMSEAQTLASATGVDMETAYRSVGSKRGLSKEIMDTHLGMMRNSVGAFQSSQVSAQNTRDQTKIDRAGDNFYLSRASALVGKKISKAADYVASPAVDFINSVTEGVKNFSEFQGQGIVRYDVSGTGYKNYLTDTRSAEEEELAKRGLRKTETGKTVAITADLDAGGLFAFNTIGDDLANVARAAEKGDSIYNIKILEGLEENFHPSIITKKLGAFKRVRGIQSFEELAAAANTARIATTTLAESSAAFERGDLKEEAEVVNKGIYAGALSDAKTGQEASKNIYGRGIEDLSKEEFEALRHMTRNIPKLTESFDAYEEQGRSVLSAADRVLVESVKGAQERNTKARGELEEVIGVKNLPAAAIAKMEEIKLANGNQQQIAGLKSELGGILMSTPETSQYAATRLDELVNKAATADQKTSDLLTAFGLSSREIARGVEARGVSVMREGFLTHVNAAKDLTKDERQRLSDVSSMIGDAKSMELLATSDRFKDQRDLLAKSKADPVLEGTLSNISRISSHQMTTAELDTALTKSGIAQESHGALIQEYQNNNNSQVISAIAKNVAADIGGPTGVAAPAGPASSSATGTPQEAYSVQTQINREILSIMGALADKLGRGR